MMPIIQRYLAIEILKTSVSTLLILFTILMSNTLGSILSDISAGETPAEALFPVLLGQSVQVLSLVLPLSFFLGVVFALGRFYKDHELVVLQACGYGYRQLYQPMLINLVPMLAVSIVCSLWLGAEMLQRAKNIVDSYQNSHEIQRMKVGQFNTSSDKRHVFFMQSISDDKTVIEDITITQKLEHANVLETARQGRNRLDEDTGDLFLEVGPGRRYEGLPGQANYKIIDFETHGILIERKELRVKPLKVKEKSLTEIYHSDLKQDRIELSWRIAIPTALLVLALLSVPLSYIAPRQGRYGKIGMALVVFILYINLLGLTKSGLNSGAIPVWLNFWWVHAVFIFITIVLLKKRLNSNWFGRG